MDLLRFSCLRCTIVAYFLQKMQNATGYDPSHPDADWSGFVAPRTSRKHPDGIPAAMAVHISLEGPNQDAETVEWARPARKQMVGAARSEEASTFSLIGGPIPCEDPSAFDPSKWITEASASMGADEQNNSTDMTRLTDNGRAMHIRGKKTLVPDNHEESNNSERAKSRKEDGNTEQTPFLHNDGQDLTKLAGYRSHQGGASKSLLDGLAVDVAKNVQTAKCMAVSSSPYATDGNLPTDPYIAADGHRKKDLLLENYSSVIPGYTGKRTFI